MDQDPRAPVPEAIASGVGDSARASVEAGEGGSSTPAVTDEMMVLGGWGEVIVFRKHFHYLDLTATRLEAQIDYIHKKQSIIFSLSAGILAVLFYSEQNVLVMLPFFIALVLALWSVVPVFAGRTKRAASTDVLYFGALADKMTQIRDMPTQDHAQAMLDNLHDLSRLVWWKNRLIGWAARSFFLGTIVLIAMACWRQLGRRCLASGAVRRGALIVR